MIRLRYPSLCTHHEYSEYCTSNPDLQEVKTAEETPGSVRISSCICF